MSASSTPRCPTERTRFLRARAGVVVGSAFLLAIGVGCARLPAASRSGRPAPTCRSVLADSPSTVQWIEPTDVRDRAQLARWCATVGPVVYRPTPASLHAPAADHLTVITWNVNVGGGNVDALLDRLRRGDFTGGVPVADFVLLLQEEFRAGDGVPSLVPRGFPVPSRIAPLVRGGEREDVESVAREHGLALLYAPSMRNGFVARALEDRGNAILSTTTLGDATLIELPIEHQRRVAIATTIHGATAAGSPWTLRVADVHLDTAFALMHGGPFSARRRQAQAIVDALGASTMPTIVAGDFNTWRGGGEPAVALLKEAFPVAGASPTATWRGPLGLHASLDRVFARGVRSVDVRRLPERYGSDHYPLIANVAF